MFLKNLFKKQPRRRRCMCGGGHDLSWAILDLMQDSLKRKRKELTQLKEAYDNLMAYYFAKGLDDLTSVCNDACDKVVRKEMEIDELSNSYVSLMESLIKNCCSK